MYSFCLVEQIVHAPAADFDLTRKQRVYHIFIDERVRLENQFPILANCLQVRTSAIRWKIYYF